MKPKILFIDRDGTMITEPPVTYQVDRLDQLQLRPGLIRNLYRLQHELGYELVMVTNQDGLGTPQYPQENFNTVQEKLLEILSGEGIVFKAVHIDASFPHEQKDTRKPGTGMLQSYLDGSCNLTQSFVIGDRRTDVQLALNIGSGAILINNTADTGEWPEPVSLAANSWDDIYQYLKSRRRLTRLTRKTNETKIEVELNPDGTGKYNINTGLGFFNHMLEQLARHSQTDITLSVQGDLHIDEHHTIEDTGLVLGEAFLLATGNKQGMNRYGFTLPMDDCLAQVAIDFGGRPWIVWDATFKREYVGDMPTEMFYHFFKSFSDAARCNLNIQASGDNEHHKIEAIFKALAKSIKMALQVDSNNTNIPTTKGLL
jgi:imidazoleglycerol-phosphate dehydratase/histidinol-phosphatase